jgi:hypothetical protein
LDWQRTAMLVALLLSIERRGRVMAGWRVWGCAPDAMTVTHK